MQVQVQVQPYTLANDGLFLLCTSPFPIPIPIPIPPIRFSNFRNSHTNNSNLLVLFLFWSHALFFSLYFWSVLCGFLFFWVILGKWTQASISRYLAGLDGPRKGCQSLDKSSEIQAYPHTILHKAELPPRIEPGRWR